MRTCAAVPLPRTTETPKARYCLCDVKSLSQARKSRGALTDLLGQFVASSAVTHGQGITISITTGSGAPTLHNDTHRGLTPPALAEQVGSLTPWKQHRNTAMANIILAN